MEKLRFQSFASGSSGNCYFLGYKSVGILIDAGIGIKTIRKCLRNIGLDFENILGVFVTHDHADHVKSVGILGEKYNIPIYSTTLVHAGIAKSYCVTEKLYQSKRFIEKNEEFTLDKFKITAFQVSHDATDNVGFMVEYKDKKFVFATDLGYVCESAASHLKQADFMVFESNYDEQMLNEGLYPPHLKIRIKADTGHLSNTQCAQFLAENYSSKLKNVFLCHLSRENNMPQIAYETVKEYLQQKDIHVGSDLEVVPLNRFTPSELYLF